MKIIETVKEYQSYYSEISSENLGFVPTMGALHKGHMSLIEQSIKDNSNTVVSIYINPTQFDQLNDLNNYPNILDKDFDLLKKTGTDAVFVPTYSEIYPDNYSFQIQEKTLSKLFCGAHRNGHFNGVLTVVMKLLNIIKPTNAYFGEKDYQQLTLIKKMIEAFFFNTKVIGCPIIRESDGLAMSSRNMRLNPQQRIQAAQLYKTISSGLSAKQIQDKLTSLGFNVDYVDVLDNRLLVAAYLGKIRLIDNILYKPKKEDNT